MSCDLKSCIQVKPGEKKSEKKSEKKKSEKKKGYTFVILIMRTHCEMLFFLSNEAQDALWIISNHAGKHDHQVLHDLVEFINTKIPVW